MFTSQEYKALKNGLQIDYQEYLKDLRISLDQISNITILSDHFITEINKILINPLLDNFKSKNFYWIQLINQIFYLVDLINDEDEEALFDFFTDSEHAKDFLESINSSTSLDLSFTYLEKYEDQIISFFKIHIENCEFLDVSSSYTAIPEIGDADFISLEEKNEYFPYSENINLLKKPISFNFPKIENKFIIPRDSFDHEIIKDQVQRIQIALERLRNLSPFCYQAWQEFTSVIIPINENDIVSYSIQELPGYSLINMWQRDEIDLMDDLIHENGHHYLNYHLNQEELIFEDDELIFMSPWRKSKRTIRGLYHAYLTFFWAYKLFGDLILNTHNQSEFSDEQKAKFIQRFREEEQYLSEAQIQLQEANELGKISKSGLELLDQFEEVFLFNESELSKIHSL